MERRTVWDRQAFAEGEIPRQTFRVSLARSSDAGNSRFDATPESASEVIDEMILEAPSASIAVALFEARLAATDHPSSGVIRVELLSARSGGGTGVPVTVSRQSVSHPATT